MSKQKNLTKSTMIHLILSSDLIRLPEACPSFRSFLTPSFQSIYDLIRLKVAFFSDKGTIFVLIIRCLLLVRVCHGFTKA